MDVITKDVRALAKKELAAANRRFRMFASPHEGYVAIHAAVEAIQLAAMVKKYERSQRHDWPGGWVPDYGTGPEPLKKKGGETV